MCPAKQGKENWVKKAAEVREVAGELAGLCCLVGNPSKGASHEQRSSGARGCVVATSAKRQLKRSTELELRDGVTSAPLPFPVATVVSASISKLRDQSRALT